ncbi:hypothetical protein BVRB_6g137080 [Beta vulgaris subsp. vulgaris]|nr:hypothetical protein BVRB_6g137080 [Beta vulgaris subsp. vulgaris]
MRWRRNSRSETSCIQGPNKGTGKPQKDKAPFSNPFKLATCPFTCFYESPKRACGPIMFKPKPLIIKDSYAQNPVLSSQRPNEEGKGLIHGKGKEPMGIDEPYYSADSDLSPIEEDLMELDVAQGVIEDLGYQSGPSRVCKSLRKKKGKAADKIAKERARRTQALEKKKLGWVGNFWEKLSILEDKRKKFIEPQVGGKLVTIEEELEEWVPLKKRCKFQKCFIGKNKLKYGLSGSEGISSGKTDEPTSTSPLVATITGSTTKASFNNMSNSYHNSLAGSSDRYPNSVPSN